MGNVNKSIDVVLKSNGKVLAGQQNATLSQTSSVNETTNKIKLDWRSYLPGVRGWTVNCGGLYVVDKVSLNELEIAFTNGELITANLTIDGSSWTGSCIITSFPLNATFNKGLAYNVTLTGTGPLERV